MFARLLVFAMPSVKMSNCNHSMQLWFCETYRSWLIYIYGVSPRDSLNIANASLIDSIDEIKAVEVNAKHELQDLVAKVKSLDSIKQRASLHELLRRSKVLRNTLANTAKKRMGMEQHLETLKQSQLNQSMMTSMKHTTDALQTLGLNVTDADNIMLDLEENTHDLQAMQSTLSQNFTDVDFSTTDLETELELMLSDDALCPMSLKSKAASLLQVSERVHIDEVSKASEASLESQAIVHKLVSGNVNDDGPQDVPPPAPMPAETEPSVPTKNKKMKKTPRELQEARTVDMHGNANTNEEREAQLVT